MLAWGYDVKSRFWYCNMFNICELWTVILWYELKPWVCCAFGNVFFICRFLTNSDLKSDEKSLKFFHIFFNSFPKLIQICIALLGKLPVLYEDAPVIIFFVPHAIRSVSVSESSDLKNTLSFGGLSSLIITFTNRWRIIRYPGVVPRSSISQDSSISTVHQETITCPERC